MKRRKADAQRKTESIRLRVTAEEKAALEVIARRKRLPLSLLLITSALGDAHA